MAYGISNLMEAIVFGRLHTKMSETKWKTALVPRTSLSTYDCESDNAAKIKSGTLALSIVEYCGF